MSEKSCFWCMVRERPQEGHYGINCPDRPRTLVEAYMLGYEVGKKQVGDDED